MLGTIASYYAHNKRQWGHAKVTLPARLAPLLPAQRGLTAGCTMHDHGGRASERDGTRRIASLSPPVPTQECGHACIRAPHTVNAHAHKGQADGYERTRVPLARGGGRDAVFRASFGPENLPTFLVARANGCTSVRRNFGGCTPVLDEVGRGRRDGLNLVQGSGERDRAIYNRRGWRRGRTMNAVRKRFVYQHVPN